jgi:hypothetical protein
MRRHCFWISAALLAALLLGAAWAWHMRFSPVRAYDRLRLGMTRAEAAAAIGLPPGDNPGPDPMDFDRISHTTTVRIGGIPKPWIYDLENQSLDAWRWKDYHIRVVYSNGKVVAFYLDKIVYIDQPSPNALDKLRQYFGL